jgi:hypothetical protein
MIFAILIIVYGLWKCDTPIYWKNAAFACAWLACWGYLGTFFSGGGTLENSAGDGLITAHIRQITNDGPMMAIWGIFVILLMYGPMVYFQGRGVKCSRKAEKEAQSCKQSNQSKKII